MDSEELSVFNRAKEAFRIYPDVARESVINVVVSAIDNLEPPYKDFAVAKLSMHLKKLMLAIRANSLLCDRISNISLGSWDRLDPTQLSSTPTALDESKVASIHRQLAREWGSDGKEERTASFDRCLAAMKKYFPDEKQRGKIKVLVPGCGLGRLPFELSVLGFDAVGSEFSAHVLLASQLVLNSGLKKEEITLYPYIHSRSHWLTREDQLRSVRIPDVSFDEPQTGQMSMSVGDFFDLAFTPDVAGTFQSIVTCFFIDAPFDFYKTLDAITAVTEVGGIWVNFGPLHWHSEMSTTQEEVGGLELALEDVIELARFRGWRFLERESNIQTTYCAMHPKRMGRMVFDCEFWVAQKMRP